jgi:peptidoglycan/LPS O-acetylase OafA/YrhL
MASSSLSSAAINLPSEPIASRRVWQRGLLATVLAAIANAVIFFVVVDGFGVSDAALDWVMPTLVLSSLGALGATVVFAVLAHSARHPIRTFRLVALAVLVVSFVPDFLIAGATTPWGVPTLLLMHVVAAAIIVGGLTYEQAA